jgi:hypothetical protein
MPRRIDVPNVAAEYDYTQSLVCQKCGSATSATRRGSTPLGGGRMIDHWEIRCTSCGEADQVEFSTSSPIGAALMSELGGEAQPQQRKPWWKLW